MLKPISWAIAGLLLGTCSWAQQSSGSIRGTIKDSQGAIIPGAKVTLTDVAQGDVHPGRSNQDGVFFFNPLKPSVYRLNVEAQGFKRLIRDEIKVFANDRLDLPDVVLEVGQMTESITVAAEAILLQTRGAERAGVLTGNQVVQLALPTRNFLDLTATVPGVINNGGVGGSVNGNRNNTNNLLVDGVTNIDTGSNGGVLATMNMDQIAEFKVLTNSQPAEYGRSSGAAITVVTKSGSKSFHGTGYIFHRHEGLNANQWINNQQPQANGLARQRQLYRYNFAGFNIGGPVAIPGKWEKFREKLFFFAGIEWQEQLSPNGLRNVTVPSLLERTGDFSRTTDGTGRLVPIQDPLNGKAPFPGGIIPANRFNADGAKILNWYPKPNASDNAYNFQSQVSDTFPRRENIFRGDYNINDKWRVYSRYMYTKSSQNRAYGQWSADYNIPYAPMNFGNPGWSLIANVTTTLSPSLTNEFIFGSSKNDLNINPIDDTFARSKLNLSYTMPFPKADPLGLVQNWRYNVPNSPFTGFNGTPFLNFNHTFDVTDNVTKVLGRHTLKAGIYLHKSLKDQTAFTSVNGDIWFDRDGQNPGDTNWAFSNALLGNYQRLAQSNTVLNGQYRDWNIEWFVQDNWRLSNRFTLDYGLRFYWIQPQYDAALQTASFNPALYDRAASAVQIQPGVADGRNVGINPLTGATVPFALVGSIVNTGRGFVNGLFANGMGLAGQNNYPRGLINDRGIHYAPRIGIAYQLNDKTVIRAGFGTFYDRFQGNPVFDMLPNPPSTVRPTLYYGNLATIGQTQGTFFPASARGFDLAGHVPTTYQWNFTVQRQLSKTISFEAGYVANRGVHLLGRTDFNIVPFGSAWRPENQDPTVARPTFDGNTTKPINLYRPYAGYDSTQVTTFGAGSNYHSLQLQLNKNFGRGLQFGFAYTWSKALGTASGDGDVLHPTNFKMANYSYLTYDVAHNFVFNYVYSTPNIARGFMDNAVGRVVLNGWQISGVTTLRTGFPTNIGVGFTGLGGAAVNRIYTGSENIGPRVVVTGDPMSVSNRSLNTWFNTSVFKAPSVGSQGLESAQRLVRLPGLNNWNMSVFKNVYMGKQDGGRYLQLRLEMFNAPNHTQYTGMNTGATFNRTTGAIDNLPSAVGGGGGRYGFGAITSAADPRIIQLAAKFYF
ncbi:MAG: TonB-dependent receptor [Acidobacteria bacterium]|nr:TonB-dependent receptor [Acidobacteriota bacterium]